MATFPTEVTESVVVPVPLAGVVRLERVDADHTRVLGDTRA
jgi:hypothetical protein